MNVDVECRKNEKILKIVEKILRAESTKNIYIEHNPYLFILLIYHYVLQYLHIAENLILPI